MFNPEEVSRAIRLQQMSYRLLKWVASAVDEGFVQPEAVHYATMRDAVFAWLDGNYDDLPANVRPAQEDLPGFANLFGTYLENSFDLDANPGERLYSYENHCFCHHCSWMVKAPHLKAKKLRSVHKKRARQMMKDYLVSLASEQELPLADDGVVGFAKDPALREPLGLCTYTTDLLGEAQRPCRGSSFPGSLADLRVDDRRLSEERVQALGPRHLGC